MTLTADGANAATSGAKTVNVGSYALAEVGQAEYSASAWSCTGTGGTLTGSSVALALAADVVCTITNSKVDITLVKSVGTSPPVLGPMVPSWLRLGATFTTGSR